MLLKPITQAVIRHKLAKLANLTVERIAVARNPMTHDVGNGMITRFTVHARFRAFVGCKRFLDRCLAGPFRWGAESSLIAT
jgi:hypothetical protein